MKSLFLFSLHTKSILKFTVEPLMSQIILTMSLLCFWTLIMLGSRSMGGSESSRNTSKKSSFVLPKMNEGLTGLERHEGE